MTIRLIAWDGNANFGDRLTEHILRRDYGVEPVNAHWSTGNLVGAGSILQMAPASFDGIVFTTGMIGRQQPISLPNADVRAVRGVRTWNQLADPWDGSGVVLGDIGILAPTLSLTTAAVGSIVSRDLAWIPHYADKRRPGEGWHDLDGDYVDIQMPPAQLIPLVASYSTVRTSSLHGMILADALGIPHAYHPAPEVIGGDWKFLDYLSAFGISNLEPGVMRLTPRDLMIERQSAIRGVLDRIVEELT